MNNLMFPLILQLIGIAVIIVEVIVPTGGLLAFVSTGLLGGSLYLVFTRVSPAVGYLFVAADMVVIPVTVFIGFKLLARSPVSLKKSLTKEDGVQSQSPELEQVLGMEGKTLTPLRPSGVALIDGKRLDVVSRGEYLEKSTDIVVTSVTGNQIIVSKKE
jgi:membrane-bound serine protease (ClpP class)